MGHEAVVTTGQSSNETSGYVYVDPNSTMSTQGEPTQLETIIADSIQQTNITYDQLNRLEVLVNKLSNRDVAMMKEDENCDAKQPTQITRLQEQIMILNRNNDRFNVLLEILERTI